MEADEKGTIPCAARLLMELAAMDSGGGAANPASPVLSPPLKLPLDDTVWHSSARSYALRES